ncbi:MAG: porin [Lautropia sp.]|nr:porin [Lautropia sp.]
MKKILLASLIASALPTLAMAQSNVQLRGSIDVGLESLSKDANGGEKSDLQVNDGIWGASRVIIDGTEDLGNGSKGIFMLEMRARGDNGVQTDSEAFYNEAWVGLDTNFGVVKLGKQDVAIKPVLDIGDLTGQSFYYNNDALAGVIGSRNNTISYASPELAGITLSASYSAGETDPANATGDFHKQNDMYSISGTGDWGAFSFGLGYQSNDGAGLQNLKRTNQLLASVGTQLGRFGAGLTYAESKIKYENNAPSNKTKGYFGSLSFEVTESGTAYLTYRRDDPQGENNNLSGVGLAYTHGLSKRTYLYGAVGIGKQEMPGADDLKPRRVALGLRHFF